MKIPPISLYRNKILYSSIIMIAIFFGLMLVTKKWFLGVFVFSPLLIYLCIEKPFLFPIGLYAFLLPLDDVLRISGTGSTMTKLLGILTIGVLLFKGTFEKRLKRPEIASIWFILFISYALFSVCWAVNIDKALSFIPTVIGLFILYLVCASYKVRRLEYSMLKWCIVTGGFVASLFIIYKYVQGYEYSIHNRLVLEYGETRTSPNIIAFSLLIPISICIQKIIEHRFILIKAVLAIVLSVMIFSIVLTGSRGGFLGAIVVVAIYLLMLKQKLAFSAILILLGIALYLCIPDFFIDRWRNVAETGGAGRSQIWYIGLHALSEYWAFGAGMQNFQQAFNEFAYVLTSYSKADRGAHNIYIQVIVEYGIIGFILMVLATVSHYKAALYRIKQYEIDSIMLIASLWGVMVSSFFVGTIWRKSFWLLWMLIMIHQSAVKDDTEKILRHKPV